MIWKAPNYTMANQAPTKGCELFAFIVVFISEREDRSVCSNCLELAHSGVSSRWGWWWCCGGAALAANSTFERCSIRCPCTSLFAGYWYFFNSGSSSRRLLLHRACFRRFCSISSTSTFLETFSFCPWMIHLLLHCQRRRHPYHSLQIPCWTLLQMKHYFLLQQFQSRNQLQTSDQ